jgi:hypothetical protein
MLSTTTRIVVGAVALLFMLIGLSAIAFGGGSIGGLWVTILGAVVLVVVLLERQRYRSDEADRTFEPVGPGGGEPHGQLEPRFRPTDERFVDPTTGHRMRVYVDSRTGERRYLADQ